MSTLLGAACMNNTFCLGIFLALIYFKVCVYREALIVLTEHGKAHPFLPL
jgi:hypothetical protein